MSRECCADYCYASRIFQIPKLGTKLKQDAISLLLADILPTGYFAAKQAWKHPNINGILEQIRDRPDEPKIQLAIQFCILGLGPVGLVRIHILQLSTLMT